MGSERRRRPSSTRRALLRSLGALGVVGTAGCVSRGGSGGARRGRETSAPRELTVFHAGSLAPPFDRAEPAFEARRGVAVRREARGSVASTRKVTDLGRAADVLAVADFRLLRDRLLPDYGRWYAVFATNAMSVLYTADSPGASELSADNWWEVLAREGVRVGHSDPAVDPGGYRAVMTQQLGAVPFDGERLYDERTYENLRANSVVVGEETNLVTHLARGKLDYALFYRSAAAARDVRALALQPEVDLSRATDEYARHYAEARVETTSGTFTGAPIAYGMTVPSVAAAPALGATWVEDTLADAGRELLDRYGFRPVEPAVVPAGAAAAVPDRVMEHARAAERLGPLAL